MNRSFNIENIFAIDHPEKFNTVSLQMFAFQYAKNEVYKWYIDELGILPDQIKQYDQIPFLPIDFFKSHRVVTGNKPFEIVFGSSGTTGVEQSKHYVCDLSIYENSILRSFETQFGHPSNYTFLALLPSYSERKNSSLIYMVNKLMRISKSADNGFFLYNYQDLYEKMISLEYNRKKTILFGVSFALTDFFESYQPRLKYTTIIETGGMKGRKKEITREELHGFLKNATELHTIRSEYGMTELLSQAYSKDNLKFVCPPWMKVLIRDVNDPFSFLPAGKTGGINIIDLANRYSCSFIETKDLGKYCPDNSFEVLGRFDHSDIRGCNLIVS
jgi:phenylacetate-coenzyme A ligase PaaK-like adenylate-forming protein